MPPAELHGSRSGYLANLKKSQWRGGGKKENKRWKTKQKRKQGSLCVKAAEVTK